MGHPAESFNYLDFPNESADEDKLGIERLDYDKFQQLVKKTKYSLIEDSLKSPEKRRMVSRVIGTNMSLTHQNDKNLVEKIVSNDVFLGKLLGDEIEDKIEEAYDQIYESYDRGDHPIITMDTDKISHNKEGIKADNIQGTYDGQSKIVGTIGIKPFKADQRVVCEVNVKPSELVPRLTGKDMNYNGVVFFPNYIPPEKIMVLSAPKGVFPEEIKLPKPLSELKNYIN